MLILNEGDNPHLRLALGALGEFRNDSGLIVFLAPSKQEFTLLPKNDYNRSIKPRITFMGDYCLIVTSGTYSHPRLYDMRSGEIVFKSDDILSVSFW